MKHAKWELGLAISRKIETGGRNHDGNENPAIKAEHTAFVERFRSFLPPVRPDGKPARVLAPGAVDDALLLAEAGYETHALVLGPDNVKWLMERRATLPRPELLVPRELDAHDLDYARGFFDGYFSVQFHEHLISWWHHLLEVRFCSRDGAIVWVDAAGTPLKMVWHTNLVPEQQVLEQWQYWGFAERWRGSSGDMRPQFIFQMLPIGHAGFEHSGYLAWPLRLRAGERIAFDYHCAECGRP